MGDGWDRGAEATRDSTSRTYVAARGSFIDVVIEWYLEIISLKEEQVRKAQFEMERAKGIGFFAVDHRSARRVRTEGVKLRGNR